jgi:ZIP family zinc transporter
MHIGPQSIITSHLEPLYNPAPVAVLPDVLSSAISSSSLVRTLSSDNFAPKLISSSIVSIMSTDEWMPLYLSCIAGASTCLGAAVVFLHPKDPVSNLRKVSHNTMSFSLALAASVMVTVSVVSIGPECLQMPNAGQDDAFQLMPLWSFQFMQRVISFGLGVALYFALSQFAFPEPENIMEEAISSVNESMSSSDDLPPQTLSSQKMELSSKLAAVRRPRRTNSNISDEEQQALAADSNSANNKPQRHEDDEYESKPTSNASTISWSRWSSGADLDSRDQRRAWRVAMLLFVSLLFHNFPEGLAVAASALESQKLGITVTIGIMIHNIPEGIAIAIPCLAARPDSPLLGFVMASLSGLAEPAGAFVALLALRGVSQQDDEATLLNMENVLAFVAGIMITVAMYELFPEARRHTSKGKGHFVAGTIVGVIVMVATELCF